MAKGLYGRLFIWLVNTINKITESKTQALNSIGILDIFGTVLAPHATADVNNNNQLTNQATVERISQRINEPLAIFFPDE